MAEYLIVAAIAAFHLFMLGLFIVVRHSLIRMCDWAFLEVQPPPEGQVDISELRKLWNAPTDGAYEVTFSSEGGFRRHTLT